MFVALGLAAFVLVLVFVVDRTGPAQPADWRLDPAGALDPSSRAVALLVNERACAPGRSAAGRIEVAVEYAADNVKLASPAGRRVGHECVSTCGSSGATYR